MIKVECPSCRAPYELDERRMPASGVKMRCPKCGTSFHVSPDGSAEAAAAAPPRPPKRTVVGVGVPGAVAPPKVPSRPPPKAKRTMVGIGLGDVDGLSSPAVPADVAGIADLPAPAKPRAKIAPPPPAGPQPPVVPEHTDLPAPAKPRPKIAPPMPAGIGLPTPPVVPEHTDLPAPAKPRPKIAPPMPAGIGLPTPPAVPEHTDLPAPAKPRPKIAPPAPAGVADLPAPAAPKAAADDFGLDLPAPKAVADGLGLDLPAPKAAADDFGLDLPAPKAAADDFGLDLPAPKAAADDFGLDLPAPKAAADDFGLDLPAPKAAADDFGLDLPAPKAAADDFGLDLPAPKAAGGLDQDLPAPKGGGTPFDAWAADSGLGDLDLPMPKGQGDLPAPAGGNVDLPMARGSGDLPAPATGGVDLPVASRGLDLPVAAGLGLGVGLPIAAGASLPTPASTDGGSLPVLDDGDFDLEDDLALPEPRRRPRMDDDLLGEASLESDIDLTRDGRAGAGSVGFGEVDLGGNEDLEFADLPEESVGAVVSIGAPGPDVARTSRDRISVDGAAPGAAPPKRRRGIIAFAAVLAVLVLAGVGLKFTPYGLFGMYALERFLPDAGDDANAARTIESAEEVASSDTYGGIRSGLTKLAFARRDAGLNRTLLARSLVHESLYIVRFGADPSSEARARAIYARLEQRGFVAPGAELAQAADALRQGRLGQVASHLAAARREAPNDAYVDLVAGEAALARDDAAAAAQAFTSGVAHGGGARAQWGLARALLASADEGADAAIDQTLELSPGHLPARVAKAKRLLDAGHPDEALTFAKQAAGLESVGQETLNGSARDRSQAFTLVGRIHEGAGRRGQALRAYDAAISVEPFAVAALLGAGRVLFQERRFRDSLGRFEVAQQAADPEMTQPGAERPMLAEAKLGAARAMLSLERTQDAAEILSGLAIERPNDAEVLIARGQAEHALEQDDVAEQSFRRAIELAPDSFAGYLALAQLDFARDDADAAAAILSDARQHVPETAEVRRMIGESELARNNLADAIREFHAALELDAHDTGALFGAAVASRREGHLTDAERSLARLAREDIAYPGLALERGRLFEARGQADRAVRSYTRALAEHPDDVDLMLRLGAAQVAAGNIEEAQATLERVLAARRDSPEAVHFMGRVDYARGETERARQRFARAVQLDPGRGEYHLWLARVSLDRNDLGKANEEISLALERDASLGDAYWVRGRIRLRAGQVQDALFDLERALELSPGRIDAYADMGECHDQLGDRSAAIRDYERAIAHDGTRGRWLYRLGRLRVDAGRQAEARSVLARAITAGEAARPAPGWLADAHRLLGDLTRGSDRAGALAHYRKYLELAPPSAIDRDAVSAAIARLGG